MLDFTSALYLGLWHPSRSLPPYERLTLGEPAALDEPPGAAQLGAAAAALVGGERGLIASSTLHAFWDLFGALPARSLAIFSDSGSYPIAQWAIERAVVRGIPARTFAHHTPDALDRALRTGPPGCAPVVVTDGFCPGCGRFAPLRAYLELVRAHRGLLVVDDSQAVGLFGLPSPGAPYGIGGGGTARWTGTGGAEVIWCSSFAKALGVPIAAVVGGGGWIERLEERGETRVHCSPPSAAHLSALRHAFGVNLRAGEELRARLAERVLHFHARLARAGLTAIGGLFPVQRLSLPRQVDVAKLHGRLLQRGVKTVPQRSRCGPRATLAFVLTARHRLEEIDLAVDALESALARRITARSAVLSS